MLSVVVDDHDLGVNYIIRGDDHFINTFRQYYIYKFMNWDIPQYAHIPLIHGEDGTKLSKRHGAENILDLKMVVVCHLNQTASEFFRIFSGSVATCGQALSLKNLIFH